MTTVKPADIDEAWAIIGASPAGRTARLKLVDMLMSGVPEGLSDGALRDWAGRMRLARELLTLMDAETDGRDGRPTDDPAVSIARSKPAAGEPRGAARRVPPSDPADFELGALGDA